MCTRRILTHHPAGKLFWLRSYVQRVGTLWAAMIVPDGASPPEPGSLKGLAFFGDTAAEAERLAFAYLGEGVAQN